MAGRSAIPLAAVAKCGAATYLMTVAVAWWAGAWSATAADRAFIDVAIDGIRGDDARAHVVALAADAFEGREAGSRGGRAAGHYIADAIARTRLLPAGDGGGFFQHFGSYRNVLALLPGSDPALADQLIVLGAHYDHVGFGPGTGGNGPPGPIHNGADDNASGVVGLMEIAAALSGLPVAPRRSILVAWWDGEEKGLLGSTHFLRSRPARLAGLRPVFSVNLDMIGRLRDQRVEIYGSRSGVGVRSTMVRANRRAGLELFFDTQLVDDSDHYPFIVAGVPAVMVHTGLHAEYHHPDDDAERIDSDGLALVTRVALAVAVDVADRADRTPTYRPECRRESGIRDVADQVHLTAIPRPPAGRWPAWGIASCVDAADPGAPVVVRVEDESPMARAGVRRGDRITAIDGRPLVDHGDLLDRLRRAEGSVAFTIERAGRLIPKVAER